MYTVILDENLNEIDKIYLKEDFQYKKLKRIENLSNLDDLTMEFLNKFDYSIGVYSFDKNLDDFYLSFINESVLNYYSFKLEDVLGVYISDVFNNDYSPDSLFKKMKEVYKTGQQQQFYGEYYKDDILYKRFDIKFVKVKDFLCIINKDVTDYFLLSMEEEKIFNNDVTAITIIQNGHYIKCNKQYLELFNQNSYDQIIDKKIGFSGLFDDHSIKIIKKNVNKTLKEELSSLTFPIEIKKNDINSYYFNITCKYIVYKGKPAVLVINEDITDKKLNKLENEKKSKQTSVLGETLDLIQSATDTGITYQFYDNIQLSSNLYKIIERKQLESDSRINHLDDFVIDEDKHILEENYAKLKSGENNVNFIIRICTAKGNLKYIHVYLKVTYENNKLKEAIGVYKDVTEEQLYIKDLKVAVEESITLKNKLEHIQNISKTAMSYSNSEGTLDWTPSIYDLLKLDPEKYKNYHGTFFELIIEEDILSWYTVHARCSPATPEASTILRLINGEGNIAYIKCYIVYDYDDNGNEIGHINFIQDITDEIERENQLKEALNETLKLEDNLNRVQDLSKIAIGYSDKINNFKWNHEVFEILEIDPNYYDTDLYYLIERFVMDEDLKNRQNHINKLSPKCPDVEFNQRVKTGKGNIKYLKTIIHRDYDKDNNLIKHVSFNQDITREIEYQNQLKTALNDKEVLLTEVHHRVKNNLQIIISLINLDRNYEASPESILNDTENRIYAMALIHEKIYGSTSLSDVDMKDYIESLVNSLFDTYWSDIKFHSNIDSLELNMENAIPLGLIINELVNNTIKYAFPDDIIGNLYIDLIKENKHYTLIVKDDGVGLPDDFDLNNLDTLGLIVVQNLTLQIGGILTILECDGTGFKIEFNEE